MKLRTGRRLAVMATAALAAATLPLGGPGAAPAHAESSGVSTDEMVWCVLSLSCVQVKDATDWARATAEWRYGGDSLHNGVGDAFRHCIWAGAIANRVGYDAAYTQVIVHEDLSSDPISEVSMDIANDLTGLEIGIRSHDEGGDDTWGWIMTECASLADAGELAGLDGFVGAY